MNGQELNIRTRQDQGLLPGQRVPTLALCICLSIHLCQQVRAVQDKAWCWYADWNPLGLGAVRRVGPAEVAVWCLVLGCGYCQQTRVWRNPWVSQSRALLLLTLVTHSLCDREISVCRIQKYCSKRQLSRERQNIKTSYKFWPLKSSDTHHRQWTLRCSGPSHARHWFSDLTSCWNQHRST